MGAGGSQGRGAQLFPPPSPASTLLPPPFPTGNTPMRPPPSPSRIATPGVGPVPVGSHAKGVSLMEAGSWDAAVQAFGQALDNARGAACTKEAQYLAAVRLLKVHLRTRLKVEIASWSSQHEHVWHCDKQRL